MFIFLLLVRSEHALDINSYSYNNETGVDLYTVVNESPITFYLTYIVPKSSPFISTFNRAIRESGEFGFRSFVTMKINADIERNKRKRWRRNFQRFRRVQVITLSNTRDVFAFYCVCIAICCITFVIEINLKNIKEGTKKFILFLIKP